jgi:hypothetical protein
MIFLLSNVSDATNVPSEAYEFEREAHAFS